MACCIFKDCFNRPAPFSRLAFFNVPKDKRREQWLEMSGNEEVQNIPLTARRFVCEMHFDEQHLRRQFLRTTLSRDAVPFNYRIRKETPTNVESDGTGEEIQNASITQEVLDASTTTNEKDLECEFYIDQEENPGRSPVMSQIISITIDSDNSGEMNRAMPDDSPSQNNESGKRKVVNGFKPGKLLKNNRTSKIERSESNSHDSEISGAENHEPVQQVITNQTSHQQGTQHCTNELPVRMSEEEHFALSLVGPLQRLPQNKRAIAKANIFSYLMRLECGSDDEL